MKLFKQDAHHLVIVVLRFAVGATFLWFGVDKWVHPEAWQSYVTVFVPHAQDVAVARFTTVVGALEFVAGMFLVAGASLRSVSALAGLYLVAISILTGANESTIRDSAIVGGLLALFIEANGNARKPVPAQYVSYACTVYVVYLFLMGVLFLRNAS